MTIQAPAKVNLVLRILAKRRDGYHDIETLMAPISLADEIDIAVSDGDGMDFQCDHPDLPVGPENLVWRAAEGFRQETGLRFHAKIFLRKRIPHGAGLGGGSSDAAAVIKALDQLLNTGLGLQALEALAAKIGSDIPFFIRSRPALCRGRGELMQDAAALPKTPLLLLKPPFPVSTAWAYKTWSAPKRTRDPAGYPQQFHAGIELINDLEDPVFQKYLLLPAIKSWLLDQEEVAAAMMSGSGSTLFAILHQGAGTLARRAKARFGPDLWTQESII
ncbi:MAG: 4-(cytidine 5'-diphospho)-2-C-methyl-D-erythritol kinase [Verrucomicrobia bacterium]|nr:4-(cytidine 5'-diphospho)-2-C-methyl-D-erythritol kinase [Verrucomicrobiota bacterium]